MGSETLSSKLTDFAFALLLNKIYKNNEIINNYISQHLREVFNQVKNSKGIYIAWHNEDAPTAKNQSLTCPKSEQELITFIEQSISDIRACKSSLKHLSCELNIITKIFVRKNSGIEYFFKENEGYLVFYDYTKYHDVPCRLSYHFQQDIIRENVKCLSDIPHTHRIKWIKAFSYIGEITTHNNNHFVKYFQRTKKMGNLQTTTSNDKPLYPLTPRQRAASSKPKTKLQERPIIDETHLIQPFLHHTGQPFSKLITQPHDKENFQPNAIPRPTLHTPKPKKVLLTKPRTPTKQPQTPTRTPKRNANTTPNQTPTRTSRRTRLELKPVELKEGNDNSQIIRILLFIIFVSLFLVFLLYAYKFMIEGNNNQSNEENIYTKEYQYQQTQEYEYQKAQEQQYQQKQQQNQQHYQEYNQYYKSNQHSYYTKPESDELELTLLYKTLGLTPKATVDQVKKAFRELSKTYHPDKRDSSCIDCDRKFRDIVNAKEKIISIRSH